MQLQQIDVEKALRYEAPQAHELKVFFESRNILSKAIAKVLVVSDVAVRSWLNGWVVPTIKRESQLQALAQKVRDWKELNGKLFNGKAPLRKRCK